MSSFATASPTGMAPTSVRDVGVVICAYSQARWVHLQRAVASLAIQTQPPVDVVVVIDHDDLLWQRATRTLRARVLRSEGRPGLSGARNTGVRAVRGEIVAFLDDDARADQGWLAELSAPFTDPRVLGVGGWVTPDWEGSTPAWLALELYWIVGCSYRGLPPAGAALRNPIGANMAFRRSVFTDIGGFSEGIGRTADQPLGGEETELAIELHKRWPQALVLHAPRARVIHSVSTQRTTWRYLVSRCFSEGRSKALLSADVGSDAALASERRYVRSVLPRGAFAGLLDGLRGHPEGLARAASIAAALTVTAVGYALARLRAMAGYARALWRPSR